MFDGQGRLWMTARIRPPQNPAWCKAGSSHPSAKRFPIDQAVRQAAMYDPKTKQLTYIDLCFHAHHLMFAEDANNTLWFNDLGMGHSIIGWINTKMWDETHDAQKSKAGPASCSTPTATANATRTSARKILSIRRKTSSSTMSSTASIRRRTDRSGVRCKRFRDQSSA